MNTKKRIPKSPEQRLRDCETHLYFLWDARRLYPQQQERYKQIAAELRVLVCETRQNQPLLLNLMDELGFGYEVPPPGPPLDKRPVAMVGWRDDPVHQKLTRDLASAMGDDAKMAKVSETLVDLRKPIPLREFVNRALAVYIAPHDYSYKALTLAVAQQVGSSHEDDEVDEPLVQMQNIQIGGDQIHIASLIGFSDLIIKAGSMFLGFVVQNHDYQPKYFNTISVPPCQPPTQSPPTLPSMFPSAIVFMGGLLV